MLRNLSIFFRPIAFSTTLTHCQSTILYQDVDLADATVQRKAIEVLTSLAEDTKKSEGPVDWWLNDFSQWATTQVSVEIHGLWVNATLLVRLCDCFSLPPGIAGPIRDFGRLRGRRIVGGGAHCVQHWREIISQCVPVRPPRCQRCPERP